jgi:hypothetical protein
MIAERKISRVIASCHPKGLICATDADYAKVGNKMPHYGKYIPFY